MGRRTGIKEWDRRMIHKIRSGQWAAEDLQWTLAHLADDTPTLVIETIHAKLRELGSETRAEEGRSP